MGGPQSGGRPDRHDVQVELVHTGSLAPEVLAGARALLDAVFDGELTDDDWRHCLGGLHALAWRPDEVAGHELVGHAALVQRRLLHEGRVLRAGYVEGVGVRPDLQRRGIGTALMRPLEQVARRAYDIVALAASDAGAALYDARGWLRWQGPTSVLTPSGVQRTPDDDDCVFVLPGPPPEGTPLDRAPLDRTGALTCDWREGDRARQGAQGRDDQDEGVPPGVDADDLGGRHEGRRAHAVVEGAQRVAHVRAQPRGTAAQPVGDPLERGRPRRLSGHCPSLRPRGPDVRGAR
jgi:aminoglycoside 2'-N-acetyltransferase I